MTKTEFTPAKLVTLSVPTFNFSAFKSEIFKDMTPVELLATVNQMQEDLLCSHIAEDTQYRNEVIVATRLLTQMIIGIYKEMYPNRVNIAELIFE